MNHSSRILVTGRTGMVGRALVRRLTRLGYSNVLAPARAQLDLRVVAEVDAFFASNKPEFVFMIAAKVGGIAANIAEPVAFLAENLKLAVSVLEAAHKHRAKKAMFLGSSCIYPRECPQPMREDYLMTGPLEPTNEGYALAKLAGIKLAQAYWRQYGVKTICPIPCNVYGTGDHFEYERGHVLASLVRRFVDAQEQGHGAVGVWGTGVARREFLHVDDLVDGLLFLMERYDSPEVINLGSGTDVSIRELAELIREEAGFCGTIAWNRSKPDGMLAKCMDVSRIRDLGFRAAVDLKTGIRRTVQEYRELRKQGRLE